MSMLSEILATKRTEVARLKEHTPLAKLQAKMKDAPPLRDFRGALANTTSIGLIAEVKKASPSKGVIREDFDPYVIAQTYADNGATCLSVLTDEKYFQGKLKYLTGIRELVSVPLLRKDFIVDPWQLAESRLAGADAILLIVAALSPTDLRELLAQTREYGMSPLVEVHDKEEMLEALDAGADLIGINNRDLHTFRTQLSVTKNLLQEFPASPERVIVSESGILTRADVETLEKIGVNAVLVGESLMRETDIGAKVRVLLGKEAPKAVATR